MKHVVCYSGGQASALCGIEVVHRFGRENTVLLNHDMHFSVEHADIKRFKQEVADYLGLPITFANRNNATQDQFDVCVESGGFKFENGYEICTARLKTEPFMEWLKANVPDKDAIIYYGFDANEQKRITRRVGIMGGVVKTSVYKVELLVIDHENWSEVEVRRLLENNKYISPSVMALEHRTVEWDDDHPLNRHSTQEEAFRALFDGEAGEP